MRINSNIPSLVAQRNLEVTTRSIARALERLSSGKRINSARDDAAGLGLSVGLESQTRSLAQTLHQINQGMSFLQTADGAYQTQLELVQRMRELAVQSANGTLGVSDRTSLNDELQELYAEFERLSESTTYNGISLLDGSLGTLSLQVGAQKGDQIEASITSTDPNNVFTELAGDGVFSQSSSFALSSNVTRADVNDYSGDGINDILSLDSVTRKFSLRRGQSDGGFEEAITQQNSITDTIYDYGHDLDGDGDLDLLGENSSSSFSIISNQNGVFTSQTAITLPSSGFHDTHSATVGDVDGDGNLDILAVSQSGLTDTKWLFAYLGNGQGSFQLAASLDTGLATLGSPAMLDTNGDGKQEVSLDGIIYRFSNNAFSVLTSPGNGTVATAGDFDGDGDQDFVVGEVLHSIGTPYAQYFYRNNGNDTFTMVSSFNDGTDVNAFGMSSFDIDNDGKDEIIYATSTGVLKVRKLSGSSLNVIQSTTISSSSSSGALGDLNGDGVADYLAYTSNRAFVHSLSTQAVSATNQVDISTQESAVNLLTILDRALDALSGARSQLGSQMNRLESASNSNLLTMENLKSALSQIQDVDFAEETSQLVRQQVLQQSQIAVLGQANVQLQSVLALLRGF